MATKKAKKTVKKTTVKKPVAKTTNVKATASKISVLARSRDFFSKYKTTRLTNGQFIAALVAEFIGTFLFVAIFMATQGDPRYSIYALVGIALIIGGISGSFINPVMTICSWITRKIKAGKALGYLIAQALGSVAAWSLLTAYVKGTATASSMSMSPATVFTATPVAAGKEWYIFFAEIIGAAILAFGLAAAMKSRKNRESAINGAFMYAGALFIAMFITYIIVSPLGTGLVFFNPAIAFAANAVSFKLWPIAIYIIAPIIGGVVGFVLVDLLHSQIEVTVKEEK